MHFSLIVSETVRHNIEVLNFSDFLNWSYLFAEIYMFPGLRCEGRAAPPKIS